MPAKPIGFNRYALKAIRGDRRQDVIATDADCDPGHYSKLESGVRSPSLEVALRLAEVLGCDIRALVPNYDALVSETTSLDVAV